MPIALPERLSYLRLEPSEIEALELLRETIEAAPEDLRLGFQEVRILLFLGRPGDALPRAEAIAQRAPGNADAQYQLGAVRMGMRDVENAESALQRALELAPDHAAAMSDLAVLSMVRGNPEEARRLLRRVVELQPGNAAAVENLRRLEEQLGD